MRTAKDWMKAKIKDADFVFGCAVIALSPLLTIVMIGLFGDGA